MPTKPQNPLKIVGAVLLLVGSLGLFVHNIPKSHLVVAHQDKPRAKAEEAATSAAVLMARIAPKEKVPSPQAKASSSQRPAQVTRAAETGTPSQAVASSDSSQPVEDWHDTCSAEIGILCYGVSDKRLPRCLSPYDDALRPTCRDALRQKSGLIQ